jgi:hypothetical protein
MSLKLATEIGRRLGLVETPQRDQQIHSHTVLQGRDLEGQSFFPIYQEEADGSTDGFSPDKYPYKESDLIIAAQQISLGCWEKIDSVLPTHNTGKIPDLHTCRRGGGGREPATHLIETLIDFTETVENLIKAVRDEIVQCSLFAGIDDLLEKSLQLRKVMDEIKINAGARGPANVLIPDDVIDLLNNEGLKSGYECSGVDQSSATILLREFDSLGLFDDFQELMVFYYFVLNCYNNHIKEDEDTHNREFPEIMEGDELCFDFEAIRFPGRRSYLPYQSRDYETFDSRESEREFQRLREQLRADGDMDFPFFVEGLSLDELESKLAELTTNEEVIESFKRIYHDYNFVPFGNISMGTEDSETCQDPERASSKNIFVLTGPNTSGKTTLMKAVGIALNAGVSARKIAGKGRMTLADRVFDNFNVGDDLKKKISTFKAQILDAKAFFEEATPKSLGLFDEFLNGTSPIYQLAIGWAILESIRDKNLRAIIATHDPYISYFCREDGYERIKGIYGDAVDYHDDSEVTSEPSSTHISLDHGRQILSRPSIDSDALPVLEEALPELGRRAREIFEHITSG